MPVVKRIGYYTVVKMVLYIFLLGLNIWCWGASLAQWVCGPYATWPESSSLGCSFTAGLPLSLYALSCLSPPLLSAKSKMPKKKKFFKLMFLCFHLWIKYGFVRFSNDCILDFLFFFNWIYQILLDADSEWHIQHLMSRKRK